jgi:hypothetical protein
MNGRENSITSPPSVDFKTLLTSVRPARVAVFVDSTDPDWRQTCLSVVEFLSTVWGGKYCLIVPTDGNTISEIFWLLLEAYDPDYLFSYRKTMGDKKRFDPATFQQTLETAIAQSPWGANDSVRADIDDALKRTFTSDFGISFELQEQLKFRISPLFFENWAVQTSPVVQGSEATHPLTAVHKIMKHSSKPTDILQFRSNGLPDLLDLWHASVTGRFSESYRKKLRDGGVQVSEQSFSPDQADRLFHFVMVERKFATPFDLSMMQLTEYSPQGFHHWNEPAVVVVGDSIEDFCLFQNLSRIRSRVLWLPASWGLQSAKSAGSSPTHTDRYLSSFVHSAFIVGTSRTHASRMTFVSASIGLADVEAIRLSIAASMNTAGLTSDSSNSISALIRHPSVVYESGNEGKITTLPFVDKELPGVFETPKPTRFSFVDPSEHRWITEVSVRDYVLPRHCQLGTFVARGPGWTTKEARIGRTGIAYFCPNVFINSSDIERVLTKPTFYFPDAPDLVRRLVPQTLHSNLSDKGHFLAESIRKFGGIEKLGSFLRDPKKRAVLDKYLDKTKPAKGITDEGVLLNSDRHRYLNFVCIEKILGTDNKEVARFVDSLIKASILYRGFIFKCAFCRNADWFSVDEITHEFKCKRCGWVQIYTSEHWRMPDEPAWYYKLDEIVYQGHSNNMIVPALALCCLNDTKSQSLLYTTELEFFDRISGELIGELDFFCVVDGVLTIGEAKKENTLGASGPDDREICLKYQKFAKDLGARRVIFATASNAWSQRTSEQIGEVFSTGAIRHQLLTEFDLFG